MSDVERYETLAKDAIKRGDLKTALEEYTNALQAERLQHGGDTPKSAEILNNSALVFNRVGSPGLALAAYKKAIDIHRKVDPRSADMAVSLHNMALMLQSKGDLDGAWKCLTEELSIWNDIAQTNPGIIHYIATCLITLGEIMEVRKNFDGAKQNYSQALELREIIFGSDHPYVGEALTALGFICLQQGDVNEAKAHLERALPLLLKAPRSESDPILINNVRDALAKLGVQKKSGFFGRFNKN